MFWSNNLFNYSVPYIYRFQDKAYLAHNKGIIEIHYCPMCGTKIGKEVVPLKIEKE